MGRARASNQHLQPFVARNPSAQESTDSTVPVSTDEGNTLSVDTRGHTQNSKSGHGIAGITFDFPTEGAVLLESLITRPLPLGTRIESSYERDLPHRVGGPARIESTPERTLIETYIEYGIVHRADGPAHVITFQDGTVINAYYLNGVLQP